MNTSVIFYVFVALLFLMATIMTGMPALLIGFMVALLLAKVEEWIGEVHEF